MTSGPHHGQIVQWPASLATTGANTSTPNVREKSALGHWFSTHVRWERAGQ
jgi:hypothetical protein